ncbi:predicted protein [Uncinocarpus reesii 1704]|uniref:C2H2-type domain-containing protein n=1 Tax=Uncinocarpus reesii (strain UAMH 1704) TaxID=336963 RepID=C4JYF9_UNCRE|nr:uncharacterized protein UREG_07210 [Uncinocarpus reesii 1704]EEP82345.1 predicted protein [Uncinocarpus reesii 1704]
MAPVYESSVPTIAGSTPPRVKTRKSKHALAVAESRASNSDWQNNRDDGPRKKRKSATIDDRWRASIVSAMAVPIDLGTPDAKGLGWIGPVRRAGAWAILHCPWKNTGHLPVEVPAATGAGSSRLGGRTWPSASAVLGDTQYMPSATGLPAAICLLAPIMLTHNHYSHPLSSSSSPYPPSQPFRHRNLCASDSIVADSPQQHSFAPYHHHSSDLSPATQHALYSPSSSSQPFSAAPLTPALSQHSQLRYLSTPPPSSVAASPTYSSPAFSTQNSPSTDFDSSFWPDSACFSMQDSNYSSAGVSHTPPAKLFQPALFGDEGFDHQDIADASMLLQNGLPLDTNEFNNLLSPAKLSPNTQRLQPQFYAGINHKRASSGSSIVSLPSTSAVPALESSFSSVSSPANTTYQGGYSISSPSRPLPTPQRTPVQNSFLAPPSQYDARAGNVNATEADMAMRRALLEQQGNAQQEQQQQFYRPQPQQQADDEIAYPYSLAQSASTVSQNSPATPQTSYQDDFDESSKALSHGETSATEIDRWIHECLHADVFADLGPQLNNQVGMSNLDRTLTDALQDELYNPAMTTAPQERRPPQARVSKPYSPYLNVMADRLHAATQSHMSARSQSPTSIARQRSPFRHGSPYAQIPTAYSSAHLQQPPPSTGLRGMELMGADSEEQEETKTISPKDALLDYHESDESNIPLFPSQPDPQYNLPPTSSTFQIPAFPPLSQFPNQFGQNGSQNGSQFYLPQPQQHPQMPQVPQQGVVQAPRPHQPADRTLAHHTPDFPIPMPSMESTNSERNSGVAPTPTHQQPSSPIKRPLDTSSDTGTYSCTYHGCTQRFETPARLQKHKREAHRQTTPGSHGLSRDNPSFAMRNSQAGPHKCERINPSTGKPCNSIFSRPYDLTRHEDTIHNARKQKVRCQLCTEDKTFSRNDALTRHMRVVHPDVNWPGKQRRRGRE